MSEMVLITLGVALLLGMILLIPLSRTHRHKHAHIDKVFVRKKWDEIAAMSAKPDQSARFAIIEADKLLDYALKKRGYSGETMGERLKSANHDFSYIDDVWTAHKLRNKLVHEAQYEIDRRNIARALSQFEKALKDMGAL